MIDRSKLNSMSQIINGMEDSVKKLEQARENKNSKEFEGAKKLILEFKEKLSEELKEALKSENLKK